jgi:hypothetical protein
MSSSLRLLMEALMPTADVWQSPDQANL